MGEGKAGDKGQYKERERLRYIAFFLLGITGYVRMALGGKHDFRMIKRPPCFARTTASLRRESVKELNIRHRSGHCASLVHTLE